MPNKQVKISVSIGGESGSKVFDFPYWGSDYEALLEIEKKLNFLGLDKNFKQE